MTPDEIKKLEKLEKAHQEAKCTICGKVLGYSGVTILNSSLEPQAYYCGEHVKKRGLNE
jgi:hypothetical protein